MEYLVELIIKDEEKQKYPKIIRLLLISLIISFYAIIVILSFIIGISLIQTELLSGLMVILFSILFLIVVTSRFYYIYKKKK